MKNCNKIHPLLPLYREGQLTAGENNLVAAHLEECGQARVELAELGRIRQALQALPEPKMPSDLHAKIMARLGVKTKSDWRKTWVLPSWGLATAAALTFILLNQNPNWRQMSGFAPKSQTKEVKNASASEKSAVTPMAYAKEESNAVSNGGNAKLDKAASSQKKAAAIAAPSAETYSMAEGEAPRKAKRSAAKDGEKDLGVNEPQPFAGNAGATTDQTTVAEKSAPQEAKSESVNEVQTLSTAPEARSSVQSAQPQAGAPVAQSVAQARNAMTEAPRKAFSASPVWSGNNGYSDEEFEGLATDQDSFAKYWKGLVGEQTMPTVDFSQQAVVVLMAGTKPTPGYFIRFTSIEENADQTVIHYSVTAPAPDAILAQVISHPWSMQVIRKPLKTVVFVQD